MNTQIPPSRVHDRRWNCNSYSDKSVFTELLELDFPGLEETRAAAAAENWPQAKDALLRYYQQRQSPVLPPAPLASDVQVDMEAADRACRHEFIIQEAVFKFGKQIDWLQETDSVNYLTLLNTMNYLKDLVGAYSATGNEQYAATILDLLEQWIDNVPPVAEPPNFTDWLYTGWQAFTVHARLGGTWPPTIFAVLNSPEMNADRWVKILKSLFSQTEYLMEFHSDKANHCTAEANVIFISSVLWPEFKPALEWREYALPWLEYQAINDYYPDGFSREMSTSYHWKYKKLVQSYRIAEFNQLHNVFSADYLEAIRKGFRADMMMIKPDGSGPRFNDSAGLDRTETVLEGGEMFDDPEMLWVGSRGERGQAPSVMSYMFPDARYAIMRSHWGADADYLIMDCGPYGTNHRNPNQLAVEVCAKGVRLIENAGYYRRPNNRDAEWLPKARWYGQDCRSQSTLNIVGTTQIPFNNHKDLPGLGDADGSMVCHPEFDYAFGWFGHGYAEIDDATHKPTGKRYTELTHYRRVFCLSREYWVIIDSLDGPGSHAVELHWHFRPGAAGMVEETGDCWTEQDGVRLWLRPANSEKLAVRIAEGETNPHAGWWSREYDHCVAAPEAIMRRGGPLPVAFATLLWAGKEISAGPRIDAVVPGEKATGTITIQRPGGTDYLAMPGDHQTSDGIAGLETDAELVWLRVDQQGQAEKALLARPRRLCWEGRALRQTDETVEAIELQWVDGVPEVVAEA